jgi:hypothetical protein
MVFFLAFLSLTTIVVPGFTLSQTGRVALSFVFVLTLIFGASATIRSRLCAYVVIGLTLSTFTIDMIVEFAPRYGLPTLDTALKLSCLLTLLFMTLNRTLRPGPITVYRVIGGIAGYLLIGYVWTYAYQLLVQQAPGAIHFEPGLVDTLIRQPRQLTYFSFMTLTTVGYGDVHPVHPVARSLAVAEALVG